MATQKPKPKGPAKGGGGNANGKGVTKNTGTRQVEAEKLATLRALERARNAPPPKLPTPLTPKGTPPNIRLTRGWVYSAEGYLIEPGTRRRWTGYPESGGTPVDSETVNDPRYGEIIILG
jgi:hypothetical protein